MRSQDSNALCNYLHTVRLKEYLSVFGRDVFRGRKFKRGNTLGANIQDHMDSLATQKAHVKIDENRILGEFASKRSDFDATISEMARIAEKYPDATIGRMGRQNIVMSPSVNSRVDGVSCIDFANTFGNTGFDDIEGYFYLQDGATKVYSSPGVFIVGYANYDMDSDENLHTRYDDWIKEAVSAGISLEMIEKMNQEVKRRYFSEEYTPDFTI